MSELVTGIGLLATLDPGLGEGPLGLRHDAALVLDGDRVAWVGDAAAAPAADRRTDVAGACVVPGFVDSHAHMVFGGDRTDEFAARMAGRPYAAGGIRTTVRATRAATEEALVARTSRLLDEALRSGTTSVEIKSGYGLTVEDEARLLRIAARFTDDTTFLGAHVVPEESAGDRNAYVDLVAGAMLEACRPHARWIDVFCEEGAFDVDEARRILLAGQAAGLGLRVHANQLTASGAARLGVELGAASVDHCTFLDDDDVDALAGSSTVATFVPGAEFSTRQPFPSVARLRDAGVRTAIATDCNPGSSFTTAMPFCIALAVTQMGMTPDEALAAATTGGAAALRRDDVGVLRVGSRADLVVLDAPSYVHLAYRPGVQLVAGVWRSGVRTERWAAADPAVR
ncbi:imidazolonepropionase [Curtobacterium sp. MCBD17_034]|uniref:imidazolonepropionase n=1 Tax=unclassified Curtobacterium TaxID=257496 RepID=UPI000DA7C105|nr:MULTISPECIES: imidazolonepropionase [unclassified Curtobacterium]PZF60102.1 imidazolonepropionase [Curtobacterium sp. MCBD17_034]PZM34787.1 imidazolonepropionase [Curtobacterium sp. MCBD17_031]